MARHASFVLFAFALTLVAAPAEVLAQDSLDTPGPSGAHELERDLEVIREATADFHDVEAARAAGYVPPDPDLCMYSDAGVMGYHHLNPELLDDRLEVERPEIVVYAPTTEEGRKLVNVEYAVPYSAWPRDEAPPRILGQDLKRADALEIWYLHVWVWEENPNGVFADWNPTLTCSP